MQLKEPVLQKPSRPRKLAHSYGPKTFTLAALALAALLYGAGCAPLGVQSSGQERQTRQRRAGPQTGGAPADSEANDGTGGKEMPHEKSDKNESVERSPFYAALKKALKARKMKLEEVCDGSDPVSRRVLEDYGSIFLADSRVVPPPVCIFTSEEQVQEFQERAGQTAAVIGGARIELQPAAMEALMAAREEARQLKLDITPRGGEEAARRGYDDTMRLWNTRFLPALAHWSKLGRLSKDQVQRLRALPLREQVREVLELEKTGIFFSKDFSKSILYSIAAPGSSQHIAMLALDVDQFADERVRRILARHGWFQTVKSDLPHFTYLGLEENDLSRRGLRPVVAGRQLFWIPDVRIE